MCGGREGKTPNQHAPKAVPLVVLSQWCIPRAGNEQPQQSGPAFSTFTVCPRRYTTLLTSLRCAPANATMLVPLHYASSWPTQLHGLDGPGIAISVQITAVPPRSTRSSLCVVSWKFITDDRSLVQAAASMVSVMRRSPSSNIHTVQIEFARCYIYPIYIHS
ncbi:hypothetical protein PENSPDRAFT_656704 [Peniophora sp. CONT]|nr:hypothetical protein PENSPDRAFT_656704 [Peniophora sp. CONT]